MAAGAKCTSRRRDRRITRVTAHVAGVLVHPFYKDAFLPVVRQDLAARS